MGFYSARLFSPEDEKEMERRRNGSAVWVVGWLNTAKTGKFMKTTDMYFDTFRRSHLIKNWELPVSRENSH